MACQFHPEKSGATGLGVFQRFLEDAEPTGQFGTAPSAANGLARRVIACLDVRSNDNGDLVVTKGDSYDVREKDEGGDVRNLGKPVELAGKYFKQGADEVAFLNITGYRDLPLTDAPMLEVLRRSSETVFVPLTVGGGIRDFTDSNGKSYTALEVAQLDGHTERVQYLTEHTSVEQDAKVAQAMMMEAVQFAIRLVQGRHHVLEGPATCTDPCGSLGDLGGALQGGVQQEL